MMAVMLKVNNLNCIALKRKDLLLYGVYSVFLSCVHPKLLKLKVAQGLYVHPLLKCILK
jgi:hypothetical protein